MVGLRGHGIRGGLLVRGTGGEGEEAGPGESLDVGLWPQLKLLVALREGDRFLHPGAVRGIVFFRRDLLGLRGVILVAVGPRLTILRSYPRVERVEGLEVNSIALLKSQQTFQPV